MNLLAASPPFDLRPMPARVWAVMLGLPKPESNGARRVSEAIEWLGSAKLIALDDSVAGRPPKCRLLNQDGSGRPYSRPTSNYVNLPVGLWSNHWIVPLSGRALALMIIVRDWQSGPGREGGAYIRPDDAQEKYDLSSDTWARGTKELQDAGLLNVSRERKGEVWEWVRMRNVYVLDIDKLNTPW